jgi:hypothetical protein
MQHLHHYLSKQMKLKFYRGKGRKTERQKDRKTERQKDRKTERQKDRKTERQKWDQMNPDLQVPTHSVRPKLG